MKKTVIAKNYLEKKPKRIDSIKWTQTDGKVVLEVENKGWANRLAQLLFKRPKISYIHLDEMGSFLWPQMDGITSIIELGKLVEAQFGEKANPLYERLARYIKTLEDYRFITFA